MGSNFAPLRHLRAYIDSVGATWIGYARTSAHEAILQSGWTPDPPQAYCQRCGGSVGPGEITAPGCGACRAGPALADRVVRLGVYRGDLRQWVLEIKYARWSEMGLALGDALGAAVASAGTRPAGVVPVPMHWLRRHHRGIDHTRVIAFAAARRLGVPCAAALRRRGGPPQALLPASSRRLLPAAAFKIRPRIGGWPLAGADLLLVDDVRTTGATARAAVARLRRLRPASITLGVLAVVDPGRSGPAPPAPGRAPLPTLPGQGA
jgi:predicted amidophosphoribosyltransferase